MLFLVELQWQQAEKVQVLYLHPQIQAAPGESPNIPKPTVRYNPASPGSAPGSPSV